MPHKYYAHSDHSVCRCLVCSKHITHHMSAAGGQERAMRKLVLISHGNKIAENKLAPYLKRRWRASFGGKILEF